jgi:hypothetical protein
MVPDNECVDMLVCRIRDNPNYIHGLRNRLFRSDGHRIGISRTGGIDEEIHWKRCRWNRDMHNKELCNFVHNRANLHRSERYTGVTQDLLNNAIKPGDYNPEVA